MGFHTKNGIQPGKAAIPIRFIRPVAFLHFFAIDIVVSFIPLYMKTLSANTPDLILSQNMSMGLPITVQMVFTALAILIVGSWCDKKGWQQPFFYGLLFSASGFFIAYMARSPYLFIFSLAGAGFGYGLTYISAQNFVTANLPPEKKAQGLSQYYAGCIAGSICGIATGGMLAEQIGYANVFLTGFFILLGMIFWSYFLMKPYFIGPSVQKPNPEAAAIQVSVSGFFLDKRMLCLLYLNIIPAAIILVGFMNFFIPVYLQNNGIPQSDIGRAYMTFGICLIYVAPYLTKKINTQKHSIRYIVMGGLLGGISLLTFVYISGYAAVILSIFFLGIGHSFNAVRNAYALDLDISKKIGDGRTTSLIFFHARIGQALGPVVFAWFTVAGNESIGVIKIGFVFIILNIIFLVSNRFSPRKITKTDE